MRDRGLPQAGSHERVDDVAAAGAIEEWVVWKTVSDPLERGQGGNRRRIVLPLVDIANLGAGHVTAEVRHVQGGPAERVAQLLVGHGQLRLGEQSVALTNLCAEELARIDQGTSQGVLDVLLGCVSAGHTDPERLLGARSQGKFPMELAAGAVCRLGVLPPLLLRHWSPEMIAGAPAGRRDR